MTKTEFAALRGAVRAHFKAGVHLHVAAVLGAAEAVEAGAVRAGFALRHAATAAKVEGGKLAMPALTERRARIATLTAGPLPLVEVAGELEEVTP